MISLQQLPDMAARIAALKAAATDKLPASQETNKLLVHLYVASCTELYIGYFKGMRALINSWGVAVKLTVPRDLPAYHVICPCCGNICGTLDLVKQHKLLSEACHKCPPDMRDAAWPIVGGHSLHSLAKIMQQDVCALEHFICEAMIAKRVARDLATATTDKEGNSHVPS